MLRNFRSHSSRLSILSIVAIGSLFILLLTWLAWEKGGGNVQGGNRNVDTYQHLPKDYEPEHHHYDSEFLFSTSAVIPGPPNCEILFTNGDDPSLQPTLEYGCGPSPMLFFIREKPLHYDATGDAAWIYFNESSIQRHGCVKMSITFADRAQGWKVEKTWVDVQSLPAADDCPSITLSSNSHIPATINVSNHEFIEVKCERSKKRPPHQSN